MQKEVELYEVLYLLNPSFTDQEVTKKIDFYRTFLMNRGSQVMIQNRGKRGLSYPIKGFETANFVQMVYLGNGNLISALDKEIIRDTSVLRYLTTKLPQPSENYFYKYVNNQ